MADKCQELARSIRVHSLEMTHKAKSSHIGSCLSIADILAVLYEEVMTIRPELPNWESRDRFILSKGHACAALYAVLAECGFFPKEQLDSFYQNGSLLLGHTNHYVPGVEVSTGSLGHALSIGCGMALATKQKVYVLLGDGDCDEGSTWEAAMFASQHKLANLIAIVDYNKMQALGNIASILDLNPLTKKWQAFGWTTREIDGHNPEQIEEAIQRISIYEQPICVIAHTTKGKGVSFMENKIEWHYKFPNKEELERALLELQ
jgi:transketolase